MSAIGECHGARRDARRCRDEAAKTTDPAERGRLLAEALRWEEIADEAWSDAQHEARADEYYERYGGCDDEPEEDDDCDEAGDGD